MDCRFAGFIVDRLSCGQRLFMMKLVQSKTRAPALAALEIDGEVVGLDEAIDDGARSVGRFACAEQRNTKQNQDFRRDSTDSCARWRGLIQVRPALPWLPAVF